MRSIWRDPGAEVLVGILGFAGSFAGIGLAIAALFQDTTHPLVLTAFSFAGLLFIVAVMVFCRLLHHYHVAHRYTIQIGRYLKESYGLRDRLLRRDEYLGGGAEIAAAELWEATVQDWLDVNLPDLAPEFALETISGTNDAFLYGHTSEERSRAALRLENRAVNLREILREVRT